jgi:1,4-alpha-glucan branching enzyme
MKPAWLTLALVPLVALLAGAGHDNNVEWNGITHIYWLDRAPRCPINGESFTVQFQTYHYDLTSARVNVNAGAGASWINANFVAQRGPYDVWSATIPATSAAATVSYWFELTDGTRTNYLGPSGMSATAPTSGWTLSFADHGHAPLGCTPTSDGGAVFKVWAPGSATAAVAGTFNGWSSTSLPMTKNGAYFTRKAPAPAGSDGQQYKYVFAGNNWKPDARGRALNPGDNSNTYVVNPDGYAWRESGFGTPPFEDMVIYELHVGTFSGWNDGLNRMGRFRDIVDTHLAHLLYLGVNVVELMPVTEFDYYESWGYNPVDNWAPENAYGSPTDLKYTVDKLHQNGIAVILDVVYNHFPYNGNYLWNYDGAATYFDNPAVQTPWGSQAALWKQEVREYYVDASLMWLEEYRVDGFRMDATRYMRNNDMFPGGYADGWGLMQDFTSRIRARKVQAITIAEELPNTSAIVNSTASGGAGFDAQWHDQFKIDVRQAVLDAAYGNPQMWNVAGAINGGGYDVAKLVRYVESHDEAGGDGTGPGDERLAVSIDSGNHYSKWAQGRSKMAQGLALLAAGIPMFLQGGEWLEDIKFGSSQYERIDWSKAVSRAPIVLFFRDLIGVRRANCGLRANAGQIVFHINDGDNVIAFHRWDVYGNDLVVVASLNNADLHNYQIGFPQYGTWHEILNSQASVYLGNGAGNGGSVFTVGPAWDGQDQSAYLTIPEMGLLVFRYEDPAGRGSDLDHDGDVDVGDYASLQQAGHQTGCGMAADLRENGRIDDEDLAELGQNMTGAH